jgi:hypothetical protein
MSKRTKTILIIVIIVIVGLAIALILKNRLAPSDQLFNAPADNLNQPATPSAQGNLPSAGNILPSGPIENLTPVEQGLYNVARNFAERYGTFSTDSSFANLAEVKLFSSARLSRQIDEMIAAGQQTGEFYGITSKVLNVKVKEANEETGSGQSIVFLQRQETKANDQPRVFYQQLGLLMIKSGNNWLVDAAEWLD